MRAFWVWQLQWACCIFEIYDSVWFLDLLFWNPRYMFTVWILLIVLAGTDRLGNTGFYQIFSVSFGGWNSPRSIFTLILGES